MKQPLHDIELIERYFDNVLSPEETRDVAERLKRDYDFRKLLHREKMLVDTIRFEAARRDLEYLKNLEGSFSEKKNSHLQCVYYYLAAAACIAAIVLLVWMPAKDSSPQSLFAGYFQPHPNIFEPLLRNESDNSPRTRAFQAYEQENYQQAALLFTGLLAENEDAGMMMLLGNSNLILGNTEAAKENFSGVIRISPELSAGAKWYLALTHLQSAEPDSAKQLLLEVSETGTPYAEKAGRLLAELE